MTATVVPGAVEPLLSAAALERLRDMARQEQAHAALLRKTDIDLLGALDVLRDGSLTRAGLLLAGHTDAIARHLPHYTWTHERMKSATVYVDRADGRDTRELALPLALHAIEARIDADNPITTVEHGLHHYEFRAYPTVALREALLNALCHLDLRLRGKRGTRRVQAAGDIGRFAPSSPTRARPGAHSTSTTCWCCATCSGTRRSTPAPPRNSASGAMPRCATSSTRWCRSTTTWSGGASGAVRGGG